MMEDGLIGKMVEVHLLNGNRFLGKVKVKDRDGVTLCCIPLSVLDTAATGTNLLELLPQMLHTLFFPYSTIEYLDIGGEPVGFDALFASFFGGRPLSRIFELNPPEASRQGSE